MTLRGDCWVFSMIGWDQLIYSIESAAEDDDDGDGDDGDL